MVSHNKENNNNIVMHQTEMLQGSSIPSLQMEDHQLKS
jgi:hypothetical protein